MKRVKIDKDVLISLLEDYGSVGKVSSVTGVPYSTIYSWYKKDKIELPPSCMTIYEELRSVDISELHRSVILGSILGDGSLLKNKSSKNARLQIGHCTKQLDYLEWKKSLLDPFVKGKTHQAEKPGPKEICGKTSYSTGYYLFNTIAHPNITEYYNKFYFRGLKRVHEDVIKDLDELALAIWLADDGSFGMRKECKYSIRGSIATCSFTIEENRILMEALKKFYKGHICLSTSGPNPCLYLSGTKHIEALLDLVVPFLPESIHYKFAPQRLHAKPLCRVKI